MEVAPNNRSKKAKANSINNDCHMTSSQNAKSEKVC